MPEDNTTTVVASPDASQDVKPIQGNTAQDQARREMYEKHYGTAGGTQQDSTPDTSTNSTAAQADTSTTVGGDPAPLPPQYIEALQAVQRELEQLRASQVRPAPVEATPDPNAEPAWISLLREGKTQEATAALAAEVAKQVEQKVKPDTIEAAVARAREISRAENEIESFVKDLRTANPELVPIEQWVTYDAQARLEAVQASGKIKTTEDAIREYKKAVLDATESARKIAQTFRGSGKTEAMTRSRDVLTASTLSPQQVDTSRTQQGSDPNKAPEPETLDNYFEKRKAQESQRRGLAV